MLKVPHKKCEGVSYSREELPRFGFVIVIRSVSLTGWLAGNWLAGNWLAGNWLAGGLTGGLTD